MKKIKVVLIGAGGRGTIYTNIMADMPNEFEVVAVAEPNESRRNNIIALVVCFFVAIFIWAFVISIDTELYEKKYENVEIYIIERNIVCCYVGGM